MYMCIGTVEKCKQFERCFWSWGSSVFRGFTVQVMSIVCTIMSCLMLTIKAWNFHYVCLLDQYCNIIKFCINDCHQKSIVQGLKSNYENSKKKITRQREVIQIKIQYWEELWLLDTFIFNSLVKKNSVLIRF